MEKAFQNNQIKNEARLSVELQRIMKRIAEYFFRKNKRVKSQIGGAIMGGTAWKTFTEELQEKDTELRKKDMELRVIKAKMRGMSEEDIAEEEGISVEEVKKML